MAANLLHEVVRGIHQVVVCPMVSNIIDSRKAITQDCFRNAAQSRADARQLLQDLDNRALPFHDPRLVAHLSFDTAQALLDLPREFFGRGGRFVFLGADVPPFRLN